MFIVRFLSRDEVLLGRVRAIDMMKLLLFKYMNDWQWLTYRAQHITRLYARARVCENKIVNIG